MSDEEETYSTIFTALRHTIRRRILRMLSAEPMTFTEILNRLGIESSHLTYHLESLGVLTAKTKTGKYQLSTFGRAAVSMMGWVEEAPKTEPKPIPLTTMWKAIIVVLVVGIAVFSGAYYSQYQILTQVYMDYNKISADYTQIRDDYVDLLVEYNRTTENYNRTIDDYNRTLSDYEELLEKLKKYPPLDLPAHLWVTRLSNQTDRVFRNLTELDLMLFPELKQAISIIEGTCDVEVVVVVEFRPISEVECGYPVSSFWYCGPMIPSNDTMDITIYVGIADTTNLRGRLMVEYLKADLVYARNYTYSMHSCDGTYLGLGWSLYYRYVSYGVYQGDYYKIQIIFDNRGITIF